VTLEAENAFNEPTNFMIKQLLHPEFRFWEIDQFKKPNATPNAKSTQKRILPYRALNKYSLVNRSHLAFLPGDVNQ